MADTVVVLCSNADDSVTTHINPGPGNAAPVPATLTPAPSEVEIRREEGIFFCSFTLNATMKAVQGTQTLNLNLNGVPAETYVLTATGPLSASGEPEKHTAKRASGQPGQFRKFNRMLDYR